MLLEGLDFGLEFLDVSDVKIGSVRETGFREGSRSQTSCIIEREDMIIQTYFMLTRRGGGGYSHLLGS